MAEPNYIAVYGSLRKGMQAESKMQRMEFVGKGAINASLYALGWYPGVKLETGRETVVDVFKLSENENLRQAILQDLDNYEGYSPRFPQNSLFLRKTVQVKMGDSSNVEAFVYEYNPPVNRAPVVENGDWNDYNNVPG